MEQRKPVVVVIDSGVKSHTFPDGLVSGFGVSCIDGQYQRTPVFTDQIGHGTAVIDELIKEGPEYGLLLCIRIYGESMETDPMALLFALEEAAQISCQRVPQSFYRRVKTKTCANPYA